VTFVITLPSTVKVINNLTTTISQQEIRLTFGQVRNPISTKPTQTKQFSVHSYNSVGESIDVLDVNNVITSQVTQANDLASIELKRNGKNDEM
jgi:chemotaxis protein histidine kinase CheA